MTGELGGDANVIPCVILAMTDEDDRHYMEWLYTEHQRLMLATAWKFTSNQADVEDIVSDGCVAIIQKIDTVRKMERNVLRSYIVSTIRNTAISHRRKRQRENAMFCHVDREGAPQIADPATVEQKVLLQAELRSMRQAISQLSEREQLILRWKYQQNRSDHEIAEHFGLSDSSVRVYAMRARAHLKATVYGGEQE